jgi:DNA-directed RNA polymerase specialized sigma24 family protein
MSAAKGAVVHMTYRWDRVIGSIVAGRKQAAALLGVGMDDLMNAGRLSAHAAEDSWDPEGGRTIASWVWLQVNYDLGKVLERAGRQLGTDCEYAAAIDDEVEVDSVITIRRALDYLKAHLPSLDWTMLWLRHAEGWKGPEIAKKLGLTPDALRLRLSRARRKSDTLLRLAGMVEIDG